MANAVKISAVVTTKNEEKKLAACLKSLAFVDEVVLVDSGSTDRTLDIAKAHNCRVFVEEWKGGGPQKQSAIEKCRNDWVIILDADEVLPPYAGEKIFGLFSSGAPAAQGFSFLRKGYIGNRWIRHSDWWPDRVVRLFDRRRARMKGINHATVEVDGKVADLDVVMDHYSFNDYADMLSKVNRFSSWTSEELYKRGKGAGVLSPVLHCAWMFIRIYVIKRGFLDGFDGVVIAFSSAASTFFKYAKLYEKRNFKQ